MSSERFALVSSRFVVIILSTLAITFTYKKGPELHSFIGCPTDRLRPRTSLPIWRPNCPLRDAAARPTYSRLCGTSQRRRRDYAVSREVRRAFPGNADTARGCQRLR